MVKKLANAANFGVPSTAAAVQCGPWTFQDADGNPESETISCEININYNGIAPEQAPRIAVARNATLAQKQAAVRLKVNQLLDPYEPGNTLNNANIQITGLPV